MISLGKTRLVFLIALALVAFAGNSVLCRLALGSGSIDPITFTSVRLIGGALFLGVIFFVTRNQEGSQRPEGSWRSGIVLFVYALAFSLAYLSLSSGTGALILFGAVQVTMLRMALRSGERMQGRQWIGFAVAIAGIVYLVSPGVSAPDFRGALLMILSGAAWGLYSVAGKSVTAPIAMTTGNFMRAAVIAVPTSLIGISTMEFQLHGLILALISGVLTSGLGYVIWYKVLPMLSTTQAAVLQLLVPLLAAFGGVLFIAEAFTLRLTLASLLILGGVVFSLLGKKNQPQKVEV